MKISFRPSVGYLSGCILLALGVSLSVWLAPRLAAAAPDVARGASLFKTKCSICHETAAGKHKAGPSLFGVFGHAAGTAEGFKLYRGLKDGGWIWDDASLDAYLTDPIAYTKEKTGKSPGMVLKVSSAQEREDIVAFLKTLK